MENKLTLKTYFQTGDKPTQIQFASLIDSQIGVVQSASDLESIGEEGMAYLSLDDGYIYLYHNNNWTTPFCLKYIGTPEDGDYTLSSNTNASNIKALDNSLHNANEKIGTPANGTYVSDTNSNAQNISALDNALAGTTEIALLNATYDVGTNKYKLDENTTSSRDVIYEISLTGNTGLSPLSITRQRTIIYLHLTNNTNTDSTFSINNDNSDIITVEQNSNKWVSLLSLGTTISSLLLMQ